MMRSELISGVIPGRFWQPPSLWMPGFGIGHAGHLLITSGLNVFAPLLIG
jgi:hypothetical protein